MTKIDPTELFKNQISLTEWLSQSGFKQTAALRQEDNDKRERLSVLNRLIDLPFDRPYQFAAIDLAKPTAEFKLFLAGHGRELCALRLMPGNPELPKLRMRGHTIADAMTWFHEQSIDPVQYRADFVPHSEESLWSTIFVVNSNGIFGEIIAGSHHQLTQGFYDVGRPITFRFDFKDLQLSEDNMKAKEHLLQIFANLHVPDPNVQAQLHSELEAKFTQNYLMGYFETVTSREFGLWFIDYSRILGEMYANFSLARLESSAGTDLTGQAGSRGKARGKVKLVTNLEKQTLNDGDVLVCQMTTPAYLPLMQRAAAIVTEAGGVLSHAAIVARELGKPCLTGVRNAMTKLEDGMMVEVDADNGIVNIVERPKNG